MANPEQRNWAAVVGRWQIGPEVVQYTGPQPQYPHAFGICLTDLELTGGAISVRVRASTDAEGRILLGHRSPTERYVMAGIGGWNFAYTIGEFEPALGWRALAAAGTTANLSPQEWYQVRVAPTDQRLSLTVGGVRVLDNVLERPLTGGQAGLFAWGHQTVDFADFTADRRPGTVFVVMQFSEPYKQLYQEVIRPVAERFKLAAYHVGEVFGPGLILHDIAQGIVDATVVVAEITPVNQNVFYELGYAHALGKPTILLAERGKQLPFDIGGYRVLFYDNTIAGKRQVDEGFTKHLEAILRE
ncbi:MAG: hypothetical protein HYS14_09020 [Candidatus Rokubacteria bacterium]|nr:hypothetical protein [Candidatus Rokubacteria bacterium]